MKFAYRCILTQAIGFVKHKKLGFRFLTQVVNGKVFWKFRKISVDKFRMACYYTQALRETEVLKGIEMGEWWNW